MLVTAIKTELVRPGEYDIFKFLDNNLRELSDGSILAITSKVISICENRVVPIGSISKDELIERESAYFLPVSYSKFGYRFSIINNTLAASAGIDESNSGDNYVLWPKDSQKSANEIRGYLTKRFNLARVGVVITDSTCTPMRLGTTGVALGYSGFEALHNYINQPDLFGRPFKVSRSNVAGGLANTAVLVMGEGTEQTPLVVLSDLDFINFKSSDPTIEELEGFNIDIEEDLFGPFLKTVEWKRGKQAR